MERRYTYLGDRWTREELRGAAVRAVTRPDGRCIRGRNGSMLVEVEATGERVVVIGRMLRKTPLSSS